MNNQCPVQRKTMFRTEKDANQAKMRIWSHDPHANIHDLHSYRCPDCGSWHVGHKSYYQQVLNRQQASN